MVYDAPWTTARDNLREVLSEMDRFSSVEVVLTDGRVVRGGHPRIATEQNPEALEAGWDPEFLVMDVPHDPALIYRIRIGGVAGISVAA